MAYFPIFLNINQYSCLVVGGGATATRKIELLLQAKAQVHVVSPQLSNRLSELVAQQKISYRAGEFAVSDLNQHRLVIAATNHATVNRLIAELAKQQGVLVNVVDAPQLCDFIVPSVLNRDPIQIAISTGGAAPVLARLLRARLESAIPAAYGQLAIFMARFREILKNRFRNTTQRRDFWETVLQSSIAESVLAGNSHAAEQALLHYLEKHENQDTPRGEVYLVGAGPGDPDLLTFRALRLMQQADVVLYDRLVSPQIMELVRREAERIYVGKQMNNHTLPQEEINQLLAKLALQGKKVLRLKGGDPFVFGRGGEEIETLMAQGVPFQVVPGITAALGASAYAGIPLTHRDHAQACVFVTGHLRNNTVDLNWQMLTQPNQTVVIYMGLNGLSVICSQLIAHGLANEMPAAVVLKATTAKQRVIVGTLATLPELISAADLKVQGLIIVGSVVSLHQQLAWFVPPPSMEEIP